MNWAQIYKETQNEIIFLQIRIDCLEKEYAFWHRSLNNEYRKPIAGMEECLKRTDKIRADCKEWMYLLGVYENSLKEMDKQLAGLDDKQLEVFKLMELQKKSAEEVSQIMFISKHYVYKLSSQAHKQLAM